MFRLENKKDKPSGSSKKKPLYFDLEVEMKKNPAKKKELMEKLNSQINKIKTQMRQGQNKDSFTTFNTILQGYMSALKVINRIKVLTK